VKGWRRRSGRAVAVAGLVAAAGLSTGRLLAGDEVHIALWIGCGSGLVVMAFAGAFQSFWGGERVEEAEAAGVRIRFGTARRAVTELDARMGHQFDRTNQRIYRLERAVFDGDADEAGE
jgi:hypothetical protein